MPSHDTSDSVLALNIRTLFWSADFKLSQDIGDCRLTRTYVVHNSGAAIYVPACCLCVCNSVCMLLHTGAMRRITTWIYERHDSFWPAASAASTFPSTNSHRKKLIVKKLIVVKTKKMALFFPRKEILFTFFLYCVTINFFRWLITPSIHL